MYDVQRGVQGTCIVYRMTVSLLFNIHSLWVALFTTLAKFKFQPFLPMFIGRITHDTGNKRGPYLQRLGVEKQKIRVLPRDQRSFVLFQPHRPGGMQRSRVQCFRHAATRERLKESHVVTVSQVAFAVCMEVNARRIVNQSVLWSPTVIENKYCAVSNKYRTWHTLTM